MEGTGGGRRELIPSVYMNSLVLNSYPHFFFFPTKS